MQTCFYENKWKQIYNKIRYHISQPKYGEKNPIKGHILFKELTYINKSKFLEMCLVKIIQVDILVRIQYFPSFWIPPLDSDPNY